MINFTFEDRRRLWDENQSTAAALKKENVDLEARIENNLARIEYHERIAATVFNPCQICKGRGALREWIYQDESKIVTCTSCGGSGEKRDG